MNHSTLVHPQVVRFKEVGSPMSVVPREGQGTASYFERRGGGGGGGMTRPEGHSALPSPVQPVRKGIVWAQLQGLQPDALK